MREVRGEWSYSFKLTEKLMLVNQNSEQKILLGNTMPWGGWYFSHLHLSSFGDRVPTVECSCEFWDAFLLTLVVEYSFDLLYPFCQLELAIFLWPLERQREWIKMPSALSVSTVAASSLQACHGSMCPTTAGKTLIARTVTDNNNLCCTSQGSYFHILISVILDQLSVHSVTGVDLLWWPGSCESVPSICAVCVSACVCVCVCFIAWPPVAPGSREGNECAFICTFEVPQLPAFANYMNTGHYLISNGTSMLTIHVPQKKITLHGKKAVVLALWNVLVNFSRFFYH